jgi:hypothetical protein
MSTAPQKRTFRNAVGDMTRQKQLRERERLAELALRRDLTMADLFTCKDCGSHELRVEREYTVVETMTRFVPCDCDEGHEFAASYESEVETVMREWGYLDEEHRVEWDEGDREQQDV